jgi:ribonuclease P protein component
MITRAHRFHGHASLPALYRRAHTARGTFMNLKYAPLGKDRPYRLAVVVSRKVHKSAVVRNVIRRRLYEAVRLREKRFLASFDLAITVYSDNIATIKYPELETQLQDLFIKAGIMSSDEHAIVNVTGK